MDRCPTLSSPISITSPISCCGALSLQSHTNTHIKRWTWSRPASRTCRWSPGLWPAAAAPLQACSAAQMRDSPSQHAHVPRTYIIEPVAKLEQREILLVNAANHRSHARFSLKRHHVKQHLRLRAANTSEQRHRLNLMHIHDVARATVDKGTQGLSEEAIDTAQHNAQRGRDAACSNKLTRHHGMLAETGLFASRDDASVDIVVLSSTKLRMNTERSFSIIVKACLHTPSHTMHMRPCDLRTPCTGMHSEHQLDSLKQMREWIYSMGLMHLHEHRSTSTMYGGCVRWR